MSETPENPNTLLEEIRDGAQRTFDAPELCHLLIQMLATPDYWDDDGYLVQMQFHRDEMRTIANLMSIGIGASGANAQGNQVGIPPNNLSTFLDEANQLPDSAVLGEFVLENAVPLCDNPTQSETDN